MSFDGTEALWERIVRRAEATPESLFAVDERGVRYTFARYHDEAEAVAAGLYHDGVRPAGTVAWQMPTWLDTLVLIGALARLDCIQVPLLPNYGCREVEHACGAIGVARMITPTASGRDLPHADTKALPRFLRDEADPIRWIFHTSGTSALPKGVLHTDATTFAASRAWSVPAEITAADRLTLNFPVAHIGGLSLLNIALDVGSPLVVIERFLPDEAVALFERERVTLAGAGPAFFLGYLDVQRRSPQRRILPTVRVFPSGGAPKSPALHQQLIDVFGVGMASNYGLTECPNVTGTPMDAPPDKAAHTEGLAVQGIMLSVRDVSGKELPPGGEGELWVRGPQLCRGYVDAALDKDSFDERGFFRTGDLVSVDAEGFVSVVGRLKDIIIRKGENISAKEVEDLLHEHPKVAEAAVIGLRDIERGELCCAVITVADEGAGAPTLAELREFLLDRGLMLQKVPERLEVVDDFPRAAAYGKIVKADLRRRFN